MRRVPVLLWIIAILSSLMAIPASAAPPSNDDIADAVPIAAGVEVRTDLSEATGEVGESFCEVGGLTAWYSFAVPDSGDYLAYSTDSDFDTTLAFADALDDPIVCNDDAYLGEDSLVGADLVGGDDVYLQVDEYQDTETGRATVGVVAVAEMADDFGDAAPLTFAAGAETAVAGFAMDTTTREPAEPFRCGENTDASPYEDDLPTGWSAFTPPSSGTWFVQAIADEEVSLHVYEGTTLGTLDLLACSYGDGSDLSVLGTHVHLDGGSTYFIQVTDVDELDPWVVLRAEPSSVRGVVSVIDAGGVGYGATSDVGDHSSLTVLPDGRVAVAYHDDGRGTLRYGVRDANGAWTTELVDAHGAGDRSDDVGEYGDIEILATGRPGIAYHDDQNQVLMFAEQNEDGTWTTTVVDDTNEDPGDENIDLDVLPNGNPVIAYGNEISDLREGELRFAERAEDGTWSSELIDDTNDLVGLRGSLVISAAGRPIVAYDNYETGEILLAEQSAGGTWNLSVVGVVGLGDTEESRLVSLAELPDGSLLLATADDEDRIRVARRVGSTWTEELVDVDTDLSRSFDPELTAAPHLLVAEDGTAHLVFVDDDNTSIGVATRDVGGAWTMQEMLGEVNSPLGGSHEGRLDVQSDSFGAVLLADGRMAVSFDNDSNDWLMFAEDALIADPGGPHRFIAGGSGVLDGSASADGWGDIVSYSWSVPEGCTLTSTSVAKPTATCTGIGSRSVSLTVTDTDGFRHTATTTLAVVPPECGDEADPFLDVAGSFYGRLDVNCIWNLGVTTGTSETTYSPDDDVTRAQMASFLARLHRVVTGTDESAPESGFVDIGGSSHAEDIAYIRALGITTGTSATTYSPDDVVTRGQMAAFLTRFHTLVAGEAASPVDTDFVDIDGTRFEVEIAMLKGLGVTTGTSPTTFEPDAHVTRGQMASFLARTYRLF